VARLQWARRLRCGAGTDRYCGQLLSLLRDCATHVDTRREKEREGMSKRSEYPCIAREPRHLRTAELECSVT